MIGVCSWSLRPASPAELVERVAGTGLRAVQLALDPLRTGAWSVDATREALARAGIEVRSGMMAMAGEDYATLESIRATGGVRPDATWEANLAAAEENARLARTLDLSLVSFHAGFLPEERSDPERGVLLERLRALAECFEAHGVAVALETGQETAGTLLAVLADLDHPGIGVNFDPANMILYDRGDPVRALETLAPWVRQVHVKDARHTDTPGRWGTEVPVGDGEVDWEAFFRVLGAHAPGRDLMIEREAGHERTADIRRARALVEGLVPEAAS